MRDFRRTPASYGKGIRTEKRAGRMEMTEHELDLVMRNALALKEARTKGTLKERGMMEAGLGRRLGREQEFARPLQTAEIGRRGALAGLRGAEAEKVRYGTEFEKGLEETIKGIISSKAKYGAAKTGEAALSLREGLREERLRDEAETEAVESLTMEEEAPTTTARPVEGAKSLTKRVLGFTLPGLGISSLRDWLKHSKKEEEFVYPGIR